MLGRMTLGLLVTTIVILSGCTFYADRPVKTFGDATGGEAFERAFWRDIHRQDWKDLNAHLASNFVYITPAGRWERAGGLEQLQQLRLQDYSIGEVATEMNRDTFVVTYTITLRGTTGGQALGEQPQRRMTVWQQQKRGWMAIAHSVLGTEGK